MPAPTSILLGSGPDAAGVANRIRAAGVALYWAQGDEVPGASWMPALEAAFATAHTVLVLVGPGQDQTDPRVGLALDHAIPAGKRIVPVLLGDAKASDLRGFLRARVPVHVDQVLRCRL